VPSGQSGDAGARKIPPKTKTSQTQRVMGRSSNSPPPKSAHKQPNGFRVRWEWLERATYKLVMSAVGRRGLPVEDV
jgi:hypothetical protein